MNASTAVVVQSLTNLVGIPTREKNVFFAAGLEPINSRVESGKIFFPTADETSVYIVAFFVLFALLFLTKKVASTPLHWIGRGVDVMLGA